MSSDSDDDCYGNIAKKLQSIKSNYKEDKIRSCSLLEDSSVSVNGNSTKEDMITIDDEVPIIKGLKGDLDDSKEESVESIILRHGGKVKKRKSAAEPDNDLYVPDSPVPRGKRKVSKRIAAIQRRALAASISAQQTATNSQQPSTNSQQPSTNSQQPSTNSQQSAHSSQQTTSVGSPARGRGRARGRARGRGRGRGRRRNGTSIFNLNYNDIINDIIYSIGNTEEYDDMSETQNLFEKKPDPVVTVDDEPNDSLDENEEVSVKVYWQSSEFFKFTIRRFQKLTEIFNFFAEKESVEKGKLLFTYNDKIISIDDSPDTINYNIGKFIDGGIVNQSLSPLKKKVKHEVRSGIKLKFQCQNSKKPFETAVEPHEKLLITMMQCAEHFEKPLDKLKFYFDGDLISGKNTPTDLELEGGECIDVVIIS